MNKLYKTTCNQFFKEEHQNCGKNDSRALFPHAFYEVSTPVLSLCIAISQVRHSCQDEDNGAKEQVARPQEKSQL
jgi:hypothetical protein